MDLQKRIDRNLEQAVTFATAGGNPSHLCELSNTVFPGGARIRPRLCLAVALAAGDEAPQASNAAATAIELLHCASLVHDDLPCFDDADTRRGKPSVHTAFGETTAVLTGDALIVLAFETLRANAWPRRTGSRH
jgi:geranylgeranyl diphosphate synthase type II